MKRYIVSIATILLVVFCVPTHQVKAYSFDGFLKQIISLKDRFVGLLIEADNTSESIPIDNSTFSGDSTYLLDIKGPIYSFSINGDINLKNDDSLVRVLLIDRTGKEYLVYEIYPLIADSNVFSINNSCQETCVLNGISPVSLKIEIIDATFDLKNINSSNSLIKGLQSISETRKSKELETIAKLNQKIRSSGLNWVAGETSVSSLSYEQKKKLFRKEDGTLPDKLPNLQGFEYYKGGVFEIKEDAPAQPKGNSLKEMGSSSELPDSWDWRNVNGQNWNTSVKNQAPAGTCWAFANLGALEAQINLYYNQHLNIDLSEQMMVDCRNDGPIEGLSGFSPEWLVFNTLQPYSKIKNIGIADENCDTYVGRDYSDNSCNYNNICSDWQSRVWKNSDYFNYINGGEIGYITGSNNPANCQEHPEAHCQDLNNENQLKRLLIEKGAMYGQVLSMNHAMVLVGYDGKSNWKTEICDNDSFCNAELSCVSKACNTEGGTMKACTKMGNFEILGTYECKNQAQGLKWEYASNIICPSNEICSNGECVHSNTGEEHSYCGGYNLNFPSVVKEYAPNQGETYWIFKNSWGAGWGEGGYLKLATNLSNLNLVSIPFGPFTPPTDQNYWPAGFTGNINCEDKDNDNYCNWGISEQKPSTCPASCKPKKDCNDSDPTLGQFDENFNCMPAEVTPTAVSCDANSVIGDANGDGVLTNEDTSIINEVFTGIRQVSSINKCCLDTNRNGYVNASDALLLGKYLNGEISDATKYIGKKCSEQYSCYSKSIIGDINEDGIVTQEDANIIQKMVVNQITKPTNICCIDTNKSGGLSSADVLLISKYINNIQPYGFVGQTCGN